MESVTKVSHGRELAATQRPSFRRAVASASLRWERMSTKTVREPTGQTIAIRYGYLPLTNQSQNASHHPVHSNRTQQRTSEFKPSLEGNHARRTIAAKSDAQQSRWRRDGAGERTESSLSSGVAGRACLVGG